MFESALTFQSFWLRNSEPFQSFPSLEHWATCCHQEGGRQHNYLGTVFAPSRKRPRCQFHQDMDICQLRWSLSDGLDGNPARGRISLRYLIETSWNLAFSVLEVFWVFVYGIYGISLLLNSVFKPMAEISGKKHGRFCCCAPPISVLSRQVFQIHGLGAGHKLLKNGAGLGNDATKWGWSAGR